MNETELKLEPFTPKDPSRKSLRVGPPPFLDEISLPPHSDDSRSEIGSCGIDDGAVDFPPPLLPPLPGLRSPAELDEMDGVLTRRRDRTWVQA